MQKWEYIITSTGGILEQQSAVLKEAGQNGWELVGLFEGFFYFKRRISPL